MPGAHRIVSHRDVAAALAPDAEFVSWLVHGLGPVGASFGEGVFGGVLRSVSLDWSLLQVLGIDPQVMVVAAMQKCRWWNTASGLRVWVWALPISCFEKYRSGHSASRPSASGHPWRSLAPHPWPRPRKIARSRREPATGMRIAHLAKRTAQCIDMCDQEISSMASTLDFGHFRALSSGLSEATSNGDRLDLVGAAEGRGRYVCCRPKPQTWPRMPPLPASIVSILQPFACLLTHPTWRHVRSLLAGTLLAQGTRTVTAALRVMGRQVRSRCFESVSSKSSSSAFVVNKWHSVYG
jgi:hypothetical protein